MYRLDKEAARRILRDEEAYSPPLVEKLLSSYPPVDDLFASAIRQWMLDRSIADVAVDGITVREVMENRQVHFLVAVRELNVLLDKALSPQEREKQLRYLRHRVYIL